MRITNPAGDDAGSGPRQAPPSNPPPPPSGLENNQLEDMMCNALDSFLSASEESYDTFMGGFTYLTSADVQSQGALAAGEASGGGHEMMGAGSSASAMMSLPSGSVPSIHQLRSMLTGKMAKDQRNLSLQASAVEQADLLLSREQQRPVLPAPVTVAAANVKLDEDGLEEEVLDEGTKTQAFLARVTKPPGGAKVKMGNFVDDEGSDSGDEEEGIGGGFEPSSYQASFSVNQTNSPQLAQRTSNNEITKESKSTKTVTDEGNSNETKYVNPEQVEADISNERTEASTSLVSDSAIINYHNAVKLHGKSVSEEDDNLLDLVGDTNEIDEEEDNDESNHLDINQTRQQTVVLPSRGISDLDSNQPEMVDSNTLGTSDRTRMMNDSKSQSCDEEKDSALEHVSDSDDNEADLVSHTIQTGNPNAVLFRAVINQSDDEMDDHSDDEDSKQEVLKYDPSFDTINPGEVEDLGTSLTEAELLQMRQLDFTGRMKTVEDMAEQMAQEAEYGDSCVSDAVESFQLDEDFDYDNVVLTPKFSAEEMAYLNRLAANRPKRGQPES